MLIGSTNIAADGFVDSTNATRVFAFIVKSAGTGAVVAAKNANVTEYDSITGTASQAIIRAYPGGLLFPGGCFVDVDVNTSYVTVIYKREP